MLDLIWESVATTWTRMVEWLGDLLGSGEVLALLGLAVLVLLLLLLLLRSLGPRRSSAPSENGRGRPELLISRGAIRWLEESSLTQLEMHVSNLGGGSVQLLEVAITTDLMPAPQVLELSSLVPPSRSVDITAPVEEVHGDSGFVDLYFYTPQGQKRAYRLRAVLSWEPWNGRFRIEPLEQKIEPARRLASNRLQRMQKEEWRRNHRAVPSQAEAPPMVDEPEPEPVDEPEPERKRERLEFPSDF